MTALKRRSLPHPSIRGLLLSAGAALALLVAPAAAVALPAPTLLMTTGGVGNSSIVPPPSPLYRIDPATGGVLSFTAPTGYAITGLAQDPTTGILYGVSNNKSPTAPKALLTIDPNTGAATLVGSFATGDNRIADIAFNSQGQLFGWNEGGPEGDVLVAIDKANGALTQIGVNELSTYGSGIDFDINDVLWLLGEGEGEPPPNEEGRYDTVDTATGVLTPRGQFTPIDANASSLSAASYDCARTTLYATLNNFGEPPANLLTVNTTTATLTNKGTTVTAADGLVWYCPLAFEFAKAKLTTSGGKTLKFGVLRGPRIKGATSVSFATKAGSAIAGQDFVAKSGALALANNASEGALSVRIKNNPKAGKDRTFKVVLSNPGNGGTVGNALTITVKAPKPPLPKIKGPSQTTDSTPTFKLTSKQLPAKFRCKLDNGKFKGCGKNGKKGKKYTTPPLTPGAHKLTVQVVNGAGKKSKPLKKKFTVLLP